MIEILGYIMFIFLVALSIFLGARIGKEITYSKGYSIGLREGFERGYKTYKQNILQFHEETLSELNHKDITPELSMYIIKMSKKIAQYEDKKEENI